MIGFVQIEIVITLEHIFKSLLVVVGILGFLLTQRVKL